MKNEQVKLKTVLCPNCTDELVLYEIQEDFLSGNKTLVYQCENPECDNEHDGFYHYDGEYLCEGKP